VAILKVTSSRTDALSHATSGRTLSGTAGTVNLGREGAHG
jgi:hypothetical protein